jgi:hypothetical protein
MRIDIFDQALDLASNRSIVLHDARHAEIACLRGRIWITEDPLRNDIVLDAGESHVLQVDGLAFVTGVTASTVWLREPLRAPASRLSQRLGLTAVAAAAARVAGRVGARLRGRKTGDVAPA